MPDESIFISYSRRDNVGVHAIYDKLIADHYNVWMDKSGIQGGADWWQSIKTAIDNCLVAIFFVSPEWLKSDICKDEFKYTLERGKHILPLIIHEIDFTIVNIKFPDLARRNMFHFYADPEKGYQQLLNELARLNISPQTINPEKFEFIHYPAEANSIVAIAEGDGKTLWMVGKLKDDFYLYRLDTRERDPHPQEVGKLPAHFWELHVDVNGNVLVNMVQYGTVIYPSDLTEIGEDKTYIHLGEGTIGDIVHSMTSYHDGEQTCLVLGRHEIYSLNYAGNYPQQIDFETHETLYTPRQKDKIIDLLFDERTGLLWAGTQDALICVNIADKSPRKISLDHEFVKLHPGNNKSIWLNNKICFQQFSEDGDIIKRLPENENLSIEACTSAVTHNLFWYASPSHGFLVYEPLWYLSTNGAMSPIPLRINDIDQIHWQVQPGILWFVTNEGLVYYQFDK